MSLVMTLHIGVPLTDEDKANIRRWLLEPAMPGEALADPMLNAGAVFCGVTTADIDALKQAGVVFGSAQIPPGAVISPLDAPSPAAVPASTSAPTVGAGTSAELDQRGLPWDERIHSGGRALNKDGTWRNKRGTPEALLNQVEAELRAEYPAPSAASVPEPPAPSSTTIPEPPASPAAIVPEPPAPPAPGAIGEAPLTFARLISLAQGAKARGLWTQDGITEAVQLLGLKGIGELAAHAELFDAFHALIPE